MSALARFLQRNQITKARPLPLVHTTDSYYLKKIVETGTIKTQRCNVFAGENLSYFFVGRAAYKRDLQQEAEYWELPTCLVFSFFTDGVKRIFPFDSGAFNSKRYPNFINMMDMEDFETGSDPEAPHKLIGTFFSSARNYYRLNARPREEFESKFDVEVLDEEMKALHKLIQHKDSKARGEQGSIYVSITEHSIEYLLRWLSARANFVSRDWTKIWHYVNEKAPFDERMQEVALSWIYFLGDEDHDLQQTKSVIYALLERWVPGHQGWGEFGEFLSDRLAADPSLLFSFLRPRRLFRRLIEFLSENGEVSDVLKILKFCVSEGPKDDESHVVLGYAIDVVYSRDSSEHAQRLTLAEMFDKLTE